MLCLFGYLFFVLSFGIGGDSFSWLVFFYCDFDGRRINRHPHPGRNFLLDFDPYKVKIFLYDHRTSVEWIFPSTDMSILKEFYECSKLNVRFIFLVVGNMHKMNDYPYLALSSFGLKFTVCFVLLYCNQMYFSSYLIEPV